MEEIEVIYKDKDIIAVSKPAGIIVHPDIHHKNGTVVSYLLKYFPEIGSVGENAERPGIVHRLDKDTSGILIVARNNESYMYLKEQFKNGTILKKYIALVIGNVKNESGVINKPISRSTKDFEKRVVGGGKGRAREAITEYKVKERFKDFTLLDVFPKTGRTHQIRSHLAHIGYPVACDKLYGGKKFVCPFGLGRQFLHASSLELVTPVGAKLVLEAKIPEDLANVLLQLH